MSAQTRQSGPAEGEKKETLHLIDCHHVVKSSGMKKVFGGIILQNTDFPPLPPHSLATFG